MNSRLRDIVAALLVLALGSLVLANRESVVYLDHGGSWVRSQAPQEVLFASANPTLAGQAGPMANEQQLKEALEAMGIVVD
jgi:hypothetical protein